MSLDQTRARWLVPLSIVGGFVAVLLVATMAVFGWGFFQRGTAEFRGKTNEIEQTKANGDFRIAAYNSFYDQCAGVQFLDVALDSQRDELDNTTNPDDQARLRTNITGVTAQRALAVAQYNADARKTGTVGQFRASDLPYQLPTTHERGERTSCNA